jgi:uncharacterized metal-binding protein
MKNEESCLCNSSKVLIFSCSGGSNVGQMANEAAVDLTRAGKGRLFCLAGIGAHKSGMIESARAAELLVAIDGCPVKCAAETIEHLNLEPEVCLVITDLGIEKSHELRFNEEDCRKVVEKVGQDISAFLGSQQRDREKSTSDKAKEEAGA